MQALIYYDKNDCVLEVTLTNETAGAKITGAAVALASFKKPDGTAVTGQSFPTTMPETGASSGIYRCTMSKDLAGQLGAKHLARITFNGGTGLAGEVEVEVFVRTRRGDPQ
jgi:hypothetical protein